MVCEIITEINTIGEKRTYLEFCPISKLDIASIPLNYVVSYKIIDLDDDRPADRQINSWINKNLNKIPFYFKPSMVENIYIKTFNFDEEFDDIYIEEYEENSDILTLENKKSKQIENNDILNMKKINIDVTNVDLINITIYLEENFKYHNNKKNYDIEYYTNIINLAKQALKK